MESTDCRGIIAVVARVGRAVNSDELPLLFDLAAVERDLHASLTPRFLVPLLRLRDKRMRRA